MPVLSERFSKSSAFQYYQPLGSLEKLALYIKKNVPPNLTSGQASHWHEDVESMVEAAYVDIDFDVISDAVAVSLFWDRPRTGETWSETVRSTTSSDKIEIGVLCNEPPPKDEPESLKLGGYLTVVGESANPSMWI